MRKRHYDGYLMNDGMPNIDWSKLAGQYKADAGSKIVLTIQDAKKFKSLEQLRAFHGPVREQVQKFYLQSTGEIKSLDRVKQELKEMFLIPEPQYYSDGSPVYLTLPHPDLPGETYQWHLKEYPSLESFSMGQMSDFIEQIISYFWHEHAWQIVINSKELGTEKAF